MKAFYGVFITLVTLVAFGAEAKEVRYKDYPLELKDTERVVFHVPRGSIKLGTSSAVVGNPQVGVLKARKVINDRATNEEMSRFEMLSFSARRDGSTLFIEIKGPEDKSDWVRGAEANRAEMHFEFEGPSIPVQATVRAGHVTAQNWKRGLSLVLIEGNVSLTSGEGPLNIQIQRGDVRVSGHQGNTDIDSYGAKVTISHLTGNLNLSNFAGESALTALKGSTNLLSSSGSTNVAQSSGAVEFSLGRGAFALTGFDGAVKGVSDMGPVSLTMAGDDVDIQLESSQAPVTIKLPANSGASLRLKTDEGALRLPPQIRLPLATRQYNGRLQGAGAKGVVSVKTKTGGIRIQL